MKKWREFESAREYVHSLEFRIGSDWYDYCKSGKKPEDIPTSPDIVYKNDWKGMGDWLGTGRVADKFKRSEWWDFEKAREFTRSLELKSSTEWYEYCKSSKKSKHLPSNPNQVFKKEWKGIRDWLGIEIPSGRKKNLRPFEKAREFTRSLELKDQKEWFVYCKSGNKPDDIPTVPRSAYKKEWIGMGDWLGTGNNKPRNFRSFDESKQFVHKLGLKSISEWFEYCKSGKKPDDIPYHPNGPYKNKGWRGYGDWLGTGRVASKDISEQYLSFKEVKKIVWKLNLKNAKEWFEYCKSGKKPDDIPYSVSQVYKKEWKGWGDFLNTGNISSHKRKFRSFDDSRKFVHELKLNSQREWYDYCKSGNKPDDIPQDVMKQYRNKGWKGFGDWLGTRRQPTRFAVYRTYNEAKKFAQLMGLKNQDEWSKFCKSNEKPHDIPSSPWKVYENKGWTNMRDFFGTAFLSFEDARNEVRKLAKKYNLKNGQDWQDFVKSGNKPDNIPSIPWKAYSKKRLKKI